MRCISSNCGNIGNIVGKIQTFKSKDGAWTQFEQLLKVKRKKEGVESANKIINAMVQREVVMQKRAQLAAGGKKASKEKVEKLGGVLKIKNPN